MTYLKNTIFVLFILLTASVSAFLPSQASAATKTATVKELRYRFYPKDDKCYPEGSKEFKKLSQNRIYKTLADCTKKLKNKNNGQVLGVKEKKGGANTNVSLIISENK